MHIVGDSTAALVQLAAANNGILISGSPVPGCGYTEINGDRSHPDTGGTYGACLTDWNGSVPDAADDVIIAFVSIHDAMCSSLDGCVALDVRNYGVAHTQLSALGYPVVWVATPMSGGPLLRNRIAELNAAVSAELGCELEPASVREAEMYDGLHYTQTGADLVGARLALIAENPTPC